MFELRRVRQQLLQVLAIRMMSRLEFPEVMLQGSHVLLPSTYGPRSGWHSQAF